MEKPAAKSHALVWKDRYSVRNAEIDRQHRTIFGLLNKLYESLQDKESVAPVAEMLERLSEYAIVHFRSEESLMEANNFPELEAHRTEHNKFRHKVPQLKRDFEQTFGDMTIDVFVFLKDWWINHILTTDQKYVPYISGNSDQEG